MNEIQKGIEHFGVPVMTENDPYDFNFLDNPVVQRLLKYDNPTVYVGEEKLPIIAEYISNMKKVEQRFSFQILQDLKTASVNALGFCHRPSNQIWIRSEFCAITTLLHELGHLALQHDGAVDPVQKAINEVEADSFALHVMRKCDLKKGARILLFSCSYYADLLKGIVGVDPARNLEVGAEIAEFILQRTLEN